MPSAPARLYPLRLAADLANAAQGLTGADIAYLCQRAAMFCVKDGYRTTDSRVHRTRQRSRCSEPRLAGTGLPRIRPRRSRKRPSPTGHAQARRSAWASCRSFRQRLASLHRIPRYPGMRPMRFWTSTSKGRPSTESVRRFAQVLLCRQRCDGAIGDSGGRAVADEVEERTRRNLTVAYSRRRRSGPSRRRRRRSSLHRQNRR